MEEFQQPPRLNMTVVVLDVALAFMFSFSLIGVLTLDYMHRWTAALEGAGSVEIAGVEEADFDPGVPLQGSLNSIPKEKLDSLFDNLQ